jgi:hypothetical protein
MNSVQSVHLCVLYVKENKFQNMLKDNVSFIYRKIAKIL